MSTDRIIIHNSLVERFIPRYVERVKALTVGGGRPTYRF
jgi:acyl-CoA reductase-like NAD-dependent aldehyde dehydrogenase